MRRLIPIRTPERNIQGWAEEYLMMLELPFIRLPDTLLRSIFGNPLLSGRDKRFISKYLKGLPDLIIFDRAQQRYRAIEIKADGGKMSEEQEIWRDALGTVVAHGWDEVKNAIDEFKEE